MIFVHDESPRMPDEDDPHALLVCRDLIQSALLQSPVDRHGVPDVLRYSVGRMLTHAYDRTGLLGRRVVRLRIGFDVVDVPYDPELCMRVYSVPTFRSVA